MFSVISVSADVCQVAIVVSLVSVHKKKQLQKGVLRNNVRMRWCHLKAFADWLYFWKRGLHTFSGSSTPIFSLMKRHMFRRWNKKKRFGPTGGNNAHSFI